jgi:hypothetical protein
MAPGIGGRSTVTCGPNTDSGSGRKHVSSRFVAAEPALARYTATQSVASPESLLLSVALKWLQSCGL